MAEPVNKTINGHEYVIKPFNGMTGWQYQMRLGKMVGPAIKEGMGALPKGKLDSIMDGEIDLSAIGGAVSSFMDALATNDPDGSFAKQLLAYTTRDGVPVKVEEHYAANYGEMMRALIAVVVANDFFGAGSFGFQGALEAVARNSPAS